MIKRLLKMNALKKVLIKSFKFFVVSNLYISLGVVSVYLYYSLKNEQSLKVIPLIFIFCSTYIAHHALRYIPYKKNLPLSPMFKDFYLQHKLFFSSSIALTSTFLFIILTTLDLHQWLFLSVATLIVVLYEAIIFSGFSLRHFPLFKPAFIGLAWSLLIFSFIKDFIFLDFIDCFVFILLLSLPFDIKDLQEDIKNSIKTLPQLLGRYTTHFCIFSMGLYSLSALFTQQQILFPIFSWLIYSLGIIYPPSNKLAYYALFEGLLFLRPLFYLL